MHWRHRLLVLVSDELILAVEKGAKQHTSTLIVKVLNSPHEQAVYTLITHQELQIN